MLSVLHPGHRSRDWSSVLLVVMLTIGIPITSQDSDLRPCSVATWKLSDIVLCCLQCVLPPVFSLSLSSLLSLPLPSFGKHGGG